MRGRTVTGCLVKQTMRRTAAWVWIVGVTACALGAIARLAQPHVLDFGLAKALQERDVQAAVTLEGEVAGTPAYVSPEPAAGPRRAWEGNCPPVWGLRTRSRPFDQGQSNG